jgi:hypothetical protein
MEELKEVFIRKLKVSLQNSFREYIRTCSAGARNVYMYMFRDNVLNTACEV